LKGNEIFSVGVTNNNQIKITTSETELPIILDIHNSEQLAKKLILLVKAIKMEEEEARNLGKEKQQNEYF
jgi:hypothetical protein